MSYAQYAQNRFKPKKPPPNPIMVGCLGTIYLAILYGITYGAWSVLSRTVEQIRPEWIRTFMTIPLTIDLDIRGQLIKIPFPDPVILFIELTIVVLLLMGLTTSIYSYIYAATRPKEGWELYAEEAERQARMGKGRS